MDDEILEKLMKKDYRAVIFSRYIGQFVQATEENATIRKSSEDIQLDLLSMASFSIDEISMYMVYFKYGIGFSDATPVWLLRHGDIGNDGANLIEE